MDRMRSIVFIFLAIILSGCTTYKFGVLEDKYSQYFSSNENNLNRVLKYNEDYSWLTNLPLDAGIIKVEHGVLASDEDIKKFNIPKGEYIFLSIEFKKQNILKIEVDLSSSGEKLKAVGTYIFKSYRNESCINDKSKPNWEVVKLERSEINEQCSFGFVKLFHVPKENYISNLMPKIFWFNNTIQQNIKITTSSKLNEFNFELVWHKASSMWWKILTIT